MSTLPHLLNELDVLKTSDILKAECERRGVKMKEHPEAKGLFCLKYNEETAYTKSWDNFNTRCRGLVVYFPSNSEGHIVSHPFDKFYNPDEHPSTHYKILERKGAFKAYEKLDGTMIVAGWDDDLGWIINTGSEFVNPYCEKAKLYFDVMIEDDIKDYTLIFELIDPDLENVINYTKKGYRPNLYLLGMRDKRTDRRISLWEIEELQQKYPKLAQYPLPKLYSFDSLNAVIENCKELPYNEEGYVLYYPDETMVKVKSLAYLRAHRLVWDYSDDRVLEMIQAGDEGELKEYLKGVPEEYTKDIQETLTAAKRAELEYTKAIYSLYALALMNSTRKEFALWVNKDVPQPLRPFLFSMLDGHTEVSKVKLYKLFRDKILSWKDLAAIESSTGVLSTK